MQERSEPVLLQRAFVGRERELVELRQGLADALAGAGRLFLISGEPGIGKTRLAEEFSTEARARGTRVIWAGVGRGTARQPTGHGSKSSDPVLAKRTALASTTCSNLRRLRLPTCCRK
jgi:AAA ATPase domain